VCDAASSSDPSGRKDDMIHAPLSTLALVLVACSDDSAPLDASSVDAFRDPADAGDAPDGGADPRDAAPDAHREEAAYFISPDGDDTNPGTAAEPWAITGLIVHRDLYGGTIVELADGTYDVRALVDAAEAFSRPAINLQGGREGSPTVIRSATPRGAHLTARTEAGYGSTLECGILGNVAPFDGVTAGHVVIDGLRISGTTSVLLRFGLLDNERASGFYTPDISVVNSELFDTDASTLERGGNLTAASFNNVDGLVFANNYVHDIRGYAPNDPDHLSATLQWGTINALYEHNTIVRAGPFYAKRGYYFGQYNATLRYNYIDASGFRNGHSAIQDFAGDPDAVAGSYLHIHNNVLWAGNPLNLLSSNAGTQQTQSEDVRVYNNTVVFDATIPPGYGSFLVIHRYDPGAMVYNNVFVGPSLPGTVDLGICMANEGPHRVWDYNRYPADADKWSTFANGAVTFPHEAREPFSEWQAAIAGDAHSEQIDDPGFVAEGVDAERYRLAPSSPLVGAGRAGGVPDGAPVDIGAWGGATRIGHDW
jgi:hypothetical protein